MRHLPNITLLLGTAMILLPLLAQEPPPESTTESEMKYAGPQKSTEIERWSDFCEQNPSLCDGVPDVTSETGDESTDTIDWDYNVVTVDCKKYHQLCAFTARAWNLEQHFGIKRIMDNIMFVDLDGVILLAEGHDRRYLLEINRETGQMKLSEIKP